MKLVNFISFSLFMLFLIPLNLYAQISDQEIINNLELIENIDLLEQMSDEMKQEEMPIITNDDDFVDAPKRPKGNSGNFSEETK